MLFKSISFQYKQYLLIEKNFSKKNFMNNSNEFNKTIKSVLNVVINLVISVYTCTLILKKYLRCWFINLYEKTTVLKIMQISFKKIENYIKKEWIIFI